MKVLVFAVIFMEVNSMNLFAKDAYWHWTFDEGSGREVEDIGGKGYHGIVGLTEEEEEEGPVWVDGKVGKALKFNGNNYVQLENPLNSSFDAITVMAWIKPDKIKGRYSIVSNKWDAGHGGFRFECSPWWGVLTFHYGDGTKTHKVITGTYTFEPDFWSHVSATFDGEIVKLYLNGSKILEKEALGKIAEQSIRTRIGNYVGKPVYGFRGVIDDVRIYPRALTGEEIMGIIAPGKGTGLTTEAQQGN